MLPEAKSKKGMAGSRVLPSGARAPQGRGCKVLATGREHERVYRSVVILECDYTLARGSIPKSYCLLPIARSNLLAIQRESDAEVGTKTALKLNDTIPRRGIPKAYGTIVCTGRKPVTVRRKCKVRYDL